MPYYIGFEKTEEEEKVYGRKLSEEDDLERKVERSSLYYTDKEVFISEKRAEEIKKRYQTVVVQEFGDSYHLTEEERKQEERYYEAKLIAENVLHKIKRLDKYVTAMRAVLKAAQFIANDNGVYPPAEFMNKWLNGKIIIDGLEIPKYTGKDKKRINWNYITEFILSDKDVNELRKRDVEPMDDSEIEDATKRLFAPGELEEWTRPLTPEEESARRKAYIVGKCVTPLTKKERRQLMKDNPSLILEMKEIRKKEKSLQLMNGQYRVEMNKDDFTYIDRYDRERGFEKEKEPPIFNGSFGNKKDMRKYEYDVRQYEKYHTYEMYDGTLMTKAEIQELELKESLAEEGWNIRKLFVREKEEKVRKLVKVGRKNEKKLKKALMKSNARNKKRQRKRRRFLSS